MAKTKKCKFCKEDTPKEKGVTVNMAFFCSFGCAAKHGRKLSDASKKRQLAKAKRDENAKNLKRKREFKLNDTRHQHKLTQTVFNRMRVLEEMKWFRDAGLEPTCISCGKSNMDWCCGHFKTRGSQGNLRYSRKNTFLQCNRYCNMSLSGNINGNKSSRGYINGLHDRFGHEKAIEIINYCNSNTSVKKWTGQELEGMRSGFKEKIKSISFYLGL